MRKYFNLVLFILLGIFTVVYFYYLMPLSLDGIWNYGFAYNISKGLIPYRDFNMIIPPLFPSLLSLFIFIFGNHYIIYYIFIAIIMVLIVFISYKKIGYNSLFIYLIVLINPHNGYNTLALLLLFILINIKDNRNSDILKAIIISLMLLIKQTLGLLVIPSILYAKNKKKVISVYFIAILSLILYLIFNNSIMEFIDYCFLGMFDFASDNASKLGILTYIEVAICLFLVVKLINNNFKNSVLFYILLFQIISFPITDINHFVITVSPLIYYLFYIYRDKKMFLIALGIFIVDFSFLCNVYWLNMNDNIIHKNRESYMYYKKVPSYSVEYLLLFTVEVEKFNLYFFFTSIITYFFRNVSPIFYYKNTL